MKILTNQYLDRLRREMMLTPVEEIMSVLLKYYKPGTKIIITKDYWKIEE